MLRLCGESYVARIWVRGRCRYGERKNSKIQDTGTTKKIILKNKNILNKVPKKYIKQSPKIY
ncbi:hypothetical protein Hanom_Chr11g01048621 [Helianthus anomalus]